MNSTHSISVIIPVYNQKQYIQEAINSVMQQSWTPLEILIIDDGSTDGLDEKSLNLPLSYKFIRQKNQGPAKARNLGIQNASGEFLSFLDADDHWPSDRLSKMSEAFKRNPQPEIILGKVQQQDKTSSWLPSFGSSIIHRSLFKKVGLINEALTFSEDQDWFLRAKENGATILALDVIALYQRRHNQSTTYQKTWAELQIHKILKLSLDRRRNANNGQARNLKTLNSYGDKI